MTAAPFSSSLLLSILIMTTSMVVMTEASFTADFRITQSGTPLSNFGYVTGKLHYDWNTYNMKLEYTSNGYAELFVFNDDRGNGDNDDQIFYQTGTGAVCGGTCQQSSLNFEMPPLDRIPTTATSSYTKSGGVVTVNGKSCTKYINPSNANEPFMLKEIWLESSGKLVQMKMNSGRIYEITNQKSLSGNFNIPGNCKCQAKLDIILLLDGSESISDSEWTQIHVWIRGMLDAFEWGPNGAALGVVQFSDDAELELQMNSNEASLRNFFKTEIEQMKDDTDIVKGLKEVRDDILEEDVRRDDATTVLITLTDGKDNENDDVLDDIEDELEEHKDEDVDHFVVVAIGNNVDMDQLLALADEEPDSVHRYSTFATFQANIQDIVLDACSASLETPLTCGSGCCGFCMCSSCVSPDGCDDGKDCTVDELKGGTLKCCAAPREDCPSGNKCSSQTCDSNGDCVSVATPCTTSDKCKVAECTEANGCTISDKCPAPADACRKATCSSAGVCGTAPITCPSDTTCTKYECSAGRCIPKLVDCDDNDPCTLDTCSEAGGCQHVPQDCDGCCDDKVDTPCVTHQCQQGTCVPLNQCTAGTLISDGCERLTGNCRDNKCEASPVCAPSQDKCKTNTCKSGKCILEDVLVASNKCETVSTVDGVCVIRPINCPDNTPCTTFECDVSDGQCKATAKVCDDNNACTEDKCEDDGTCSFESICDDGDECTVDSCVNNQCTTAPKCPASTDPCVENYCDDGECKTRELDCGTEGACDGVDCNDNDPCTIDLCNPDLDALCAHQPKCTPTNACQTASCAADGSCSYGVVECPSDKCNTSRCVDGECKTTPVNCDDNNPCTKDSCDVNAVGGDPCVHAPFCSDIDQCTSNQCEIVNGKATCIGEPVCSDPDRCNIPECDASGTCTVRPLVCPESTKCETLTCTDGGCVGAPINCDDGNACTIDSCDDLTGCKHELQPGCGECIPSKPSDFCVERTCEDGKTVEKNLCVAKTEGCWVFTGNCVDPDVEGCEKRLSCQSEDGCSISSCENDVCTTTAIDCNDGNPCTDDTCQDGQCINTSKENKCQSAFPDLATNTCIITDITDQCDDFNLCTIDSCDPDIGCVNVNDTIFIDNCINAGPLSCTDNYCDPIRGCVGTIIECPDEPPCSVGYCVNGTCALNTPALCDDEITAIAVAGGLGTAAIIGIIVGIVVCLAIGGAAAYKGVQAFTSEEDFDKFGQSSPIYEMGTVGGSNAIYESADNIGL